MPSGKVLHSIDTQSQVPRGKPPFDPNLEAVKFLEISNDGKTLVSYHEQSFHQFWDLPTGKAIGKPFRASSPVCRFTPGATMLVTAHPDRFEFWYGKKQELQRTIKANPGELRRMVISSDGKTMVTTNAANNIHVWTIPEFKE